MKNFIQKQIANLAKKLIAKHQPLIIGITGSVGKTSTRDAVFAVVSKVYKTRKGNKNYNNEIGLPLAILGVDSPGRSVFKWIMVFFKGYLNLFIGRFPKVLVLEMGIDKPGDMDYLLSIAKPNISILTNIGIAHYEFFKTYEAVAEEKGKLVAALPSDGVAILNADNQLVMQQGSKTVAKKISYGLNSNSNVIVNILEEKFTFPVLSKIKIETNFNSFEVEVSAIGLAHTYAVAAAVAVGLNLNMSIEGIQKGLKNYKAVPGRLNFIKGIKQTVLIDDSYNASPDSMKAALAVLARMPQTNKIAILGDMLELGDLTQNGHEEIGKIAGSLNLNFLVCIGEHSKIIADNAVLSGLVAEKIKCFATSTQAIDFVKTVLEPDAAVLIKGSQAMRMEKISKELLAEPSAAAQLLPRQYGKWLDY